MNVNECIQVEKFARFHEILCSTGGRYLRDPVRSWDGVRVYYEPGDYETQCKLWRQYLTPIRETRRDQWWRVVLRRVGLKV